MPLTIPAGHGLAALRFKYGSDPEPQICTIGVRPLSPPLDTGAAERIATAWQATLRPDTISQVSLLSVVLRVRQDGGGDQVFEYVPTGTVTGGSAGAGMPSNNALLFEKRTTRGGRRGVGRMFYPGVAEVWADEQGLLTTTIVNLFTAALASFRAALIDPPTGAVTGDAVMPVLFHGNTTDTQKSVSGAVTTITKTVGAAGPAPDDITLFTVDPRVASQRRRLR